MEASVHSAPPSVDSSVVADLQTLVASMKRLLNDSSTRKTKRIRMNSVLDQACEDEVDSMEVQKYTKYYSQYVKVTGGPPSEVEECTIKQMACLHHRLACNK
eukprot:1512551-Amphidinium_carterae.1